LDLHLQHRWQSSFVAVPGIEGKDGTSAVSMHRDKLAVVKLILNVVRSGSANLELLLIRVCSQVALDCDSFEATLVMVPASVRLFEVSKERCLASVFKCDGQKLFFLDSACFGTKRAAA